MAFKLLADELLGSCRAVYELEWQRCLNHNPRCRRDYLACNSEIDYKKYALLRLLLQVKTYAKSAF